MADDEADIPRNLHNIIVSIHAIATFQALHDYLRPRVAGLLSSGSRLSGMLAALAGIGGAASRSSNGDAPPFAKPPAAASAESNSSASGSTVVRRRSQRLSAKSAGAASIGNTTADADPLATLASESASDSIPQPAPSKSPPSIEAMQNENIIDSGLEADFTDDEIDAEVFDDDVDHDNAVSDKTVTLAVAEGELPLKSL